MFSIFLIIVLIFSAIIHEYMHGWMADRLGDTTARDAGRLTLNPIPHIDPIGSILVPLIMVMSNMGFIFGWAKPVPFNPLRLKDQKYGIAKVAAAGPLGNLIIAVFLGLFIRLVPGLDINIIIFLGIAVYINLILMVFNLVPIPPLDGSKILLVFLPRDLQEKMLGLEKYGMIIVILFIMIGFQVIIPIISFLLQIIVGNEIFMVMRMAIGI